MTHPNTSRVFDEWRRQRGADRLPARTRMTAAALGPLLPQVFVLGREGGHWRFRLAGGFVCDLHGRELRGVPFVEIWRGVARADVLRAVESAFEEAQPATLHALAERDEGRWLELEVALAPLTGPTEAPDRLIGLHQPLSPLARLRGEPVPALGLVGADRGAGWPDLRLVVDNTLRVA